jgi:hypothetical protein
MKAWFQQHGQTVGGLCGISSAIAFCFGAKLVGMCLAGCAVVLVASATRAEKSA